MKVTDSHFRVSNPLTDDYVIPRRNGPADRIKTGCRGEMIDGTAEVVEASSLDEHGRYDPESNGSKHA